ncbi:hypothetical protein CKALI_00630 [Corynebacterium kalinowskii]|uniref:DUF559 domain-containing protein n=1 Tax=Corynebacterium kalinowskii TaxID=2675216 RepID=A0A6B8VNC1_9CORY|nr:DUF559 domain-containing protein [Corynebacterium kalinowskii]QGU01027.1 hypothetical protein CKALI_00630 [Corynebacterium kalinowskii]
MNTFTLPRTASEIRLSAIRNGQWVKHSYGIYSASEGAKDSAFRVRAAHLRFPSGAIGGFAALAFHGVPFWWDVDLVTVHTPARGIREEDGMHLVKGVTFTPYHGLDQHFPDLVCVDPATAAIDCLIYVLRKRINFWTPKVTGIWLHELRAIQIIDATLRYTSATRGELREAARNRLCKRKLNRLLKLADDRCDSPPETSLRLILGRLLPGWETQVAIYDDNRLITVIDFAWKRLKVAVYYDGSVHNEQRNVDRDNEITAFLEERGWTVLRVSKGMIRREEDLIRRVVQRIRQQGGPDLAMQTIENRSKRQSASPNPARVI